MVLRFIAQLLNRRRQEQKPDETRARTCTRSRTHHIHVHDPKLVEDVARALNRVYLPLYNGRVMVRLGPHGCTLAATTVLDALTLTKQEK